jgi:hypothetical protein
MPGARCTRSRAWWVESTRVSHHGRTGITRHSRTRMVLTVSFVLSPVIGLSCHRRQRNCFHRLDAGVEASGPQDFAVRVSVVRQRHCHVHRIPHPTSVTIAKRPSVWDGMASDIDLIWVRREAEYFCKPDWTGEIKLKLQENFLPTRYESQIILLAMTEDAKESSRLLRKAQAVMAGEVIVKSSLRT